MRREISRRALRGTGQQRGEMSLNLAATGPAITEARQLRRATRAQCKPFLFFSPRSVGVGRAPPAKTLRDERPERKKTKKKSSEETSPLVIVALRIRSITNYLNKAAV